MATSKYPEKGKYRTEYWHDNRHKRAFTKGFPWSQDGGIDGAAKAVSKGLVSKVQFVRRDNDRVEWTVKAGPKVPGVRIIPTVVIKGDDK